MEQANPPVSLFDLTNKFEGIPETDIFKCINGLKELGWIDEVRRFTWDISEKAIAQSIEVDEGERQQRVHRASEHIQTKADLKEAKKMLKHYPATRLIAKVVFFISIGLSGLLLRKWLMKQIHKIKVEIKEKTYHL